MEPISETTFDLVIAGTGLAQSLLALALSREGKKILHVDKNAYYGGSEAALSLQDAQDWVDSVGKGSARFLDARITAASDHASKLGFSRSYSLALAPQIVYSKTALLPTLVSSKVYRQLEFLAVGAWWIYQKNDEGIGELKRIPGSREDVFADKSIDLRSKRALMNFLKLITDIEAYGEAMETWGEKSFEEFLTQEYKISPSLQPMLHALTLSPRSAAQTKTVYALPRILRHLSSIGVFGPGFGSVIPKWGGSAEITQVACRACAVGGGIYMLGKGISDITPAEVEGVSSIKLDDNQQVKTRWVAGRSDDLPMQTIQGPTITKSISIIDSTLKQLFPVIADGAPPASCSAVVFPPTSLSIADSTSAVPVYLTVHSSETGECPEGQSVIYGSIAATSADGKQWLDQAIANLLVSLSPEEEIRQVLWSLSYAQIEDIKAEDVEEGEGPSIENSQICFSGASTDLAFDDLVLREVRKAWQQVTGKINGFMEFEDRETGEYDEEDI